jgi:hypothetical protein
MAPDEKVPERPGGQIHLSLARLRKRKDERALASKRFLQLIAPVLEALTPFPEARAAIAAEFEKLSGKRRKAPSMRRNVRQTIGK